MRDQSGITLSELLVVMAIAAVAVTVTLVYSSPWLARESVRSSANDVASFMQLARIEAVSRNTDCRFVVDTGSRVLEVRDSMGTGSVTDDQLLFQRRLPSGVAFSRPDGGATVTLEQLPSTTIYQAVFASDGIVSSGAGGVFFQGGNRWASVQVQAAGATEINYWDGQAWKAWH